MKKCRYFPTVLVFLMVPLFLTLVPPDLFDLSLLSNIESVDFSGMLFGSTEGNRKEFNNMEGMDEAYDGPLPWESDDRFLETIGKYKSIKKLAAYKAELKDPLPGEGDNIELAANKLAGQVVQPGRLFSQNRVLGPYTRQKGYRSGPTYAGTRITTTIGGGVCKVASLLYNLATFSDLQNVRRYPHSMTVPYVPPGQDATVYYGIKDIIFKNTSDNTIIIWAQKVDNTLYMAFYGFYIPPRVRWHHEIIKQLPTYTVYKRNKNLKRGEQRVVLEGGPGIVVNSHVDVQYPDGTTKVFQRGRAYYSPCPRVIERNN
jgi:vancomycin resistance protein YoaR